MKNKNFILVLFLLTISLISLIHGNCNQYIFEIRLYIGFSLLCFTVLSFLKIKGISTYLFGIILTLGTFNLIHFTPFSFYTSIFVFKIQLIPFIFLLFFYLLNRNKIRNFNVPSESEEINRKNNLIEFFKIQFQDLSEAEIDKKLKEDLVSEAIEALKILKENLTAKSTK